MAWEGNQATNFMLSSLDVYRERKCADTIGTVSVFLGWSFSMLKYKYIFKVKYRPTEAIFSNTTRKLLWF